MKTPNSRLNRRSFVKGGLTISGAATMGADLLVESSLLWSKVGSR